MRLIARQGRRRIGETRKEDDTAMCGRMARWFAFMDTHRGI